MRHGIYVKRYLCERKPQVTEKPKKNVLDKVCLCIGNLSQDATEKEIRILLEKYGEVIKCKLRLGKAYVEMVIGEKKVAYYN